MTSPHLRLALLAALALAACDETSPPDAGATDAGALDGATRPDGEIPLDGAVARDAGDASLPPTVLDDDYAPDDDPDLLNPARGVYYWAPDASDPHVLVAEWLYLGPHCDEDLVWAGAGDPATSAVLADYAARLAEHRDAGRQVLFRPRYDAASSGGVLNGCGVFQADTVERMRAHVDAIAAMLAEHLDVIAFVEAGYLGRWGEWNHADHAASTAPVLVDPDARRAFLRHVLDAYAAAGVDRFVGVRRPIFAREIVDADPSARVGLYNDCFMTNASDYGTYSNFEDGNPSNFASSEDARAWAEAFTRDAPFGGETCPTGDGAERWRDCANMVGAASEPGALHMSYLHGGYAEDARATWQAGGCWHEVRRRLGYRFEVESVEYPPTVGAGAPFAVSIRVRNTGWSRLHNPRSAHVVLRGAGGAHEAASVEGGEVTAWAPGETVTVRAIFDGVPAGAWELRLSLPDPHRPDVTAYAIAIASRRGGAPLIDRASGENDLGVTIDAAP